MIKKSVKTNYIFNATYQLVSIVVPLITMPYLSRTLKAEGMGEYAFAYSVAYMFYIFIRLGLHNYGNRAIAYIKDNEKTLSKTFWEIYTFQMLMCAIMSVLYWGYCATMSPKPKLAYILLLVVITGGIDVTWALYGLEEFVFASVRDVVIRIGTTICVFLFVNSIYDVYKYALICGGSFFIGQLLTIILVLKRIKFVFPGFSGVAKHIIPNLTLFLPTIAVSIYKTMDKIMLGAMTSDVELGYYHSSENIIAVPLALITALGTVMLPRISNMLATDKDSKETDVLLEKSIVFAMFIATSICFGIMSISKEFVPLYFGQGFDKCIELFYIILPSCIFLAFADVIRTQYLLPRKKDVQFISSLFAGAGVNLVVNLVLIPKLAAIGAAVGTLMAEGVVCTIQVIYVHRELDICKKIKRSIPFIIAGSLMFILFKDVTFAFNNRISAMFFKILICGVSYLVILFVLVTLGKVLQKTKQDNK